MASHSAPQLSFNEEMGELSELREWEWLRLFKDKYGRIPGETNTEVLNTDAVDETSIIANDDSSNEVGDESNDDNVDEENVNDNEEEEEEFEEEADIYDELMDDFFEELENIPVNQKAEYLLALVEAPDIVENESNPVLFLRCSNYEPKQAAVGLCEYWTRRVEIFNDDAYKPMTWAGACHDIVSPILDFNLQNLFRILPNDDSDRSVLCYDRTHVKFSDDFDQMVVVKYLWFVFHELLKRESVQKNGFVFIINNRELGMNFLKRNIIKSLVRNCIPIKLCCCHICCSALSLKLIVPTIKLFCPKHARQRVELHPSFKTPTIINEMKKYGLRKENLPVSIGGTYKEKPSWIYECECIVNNKHRRRKKTQRHHRRSVHV